MLEGYLVARCVCWLPVFGGSLCRTLTTANDYFILKAVEEELEILEQVKDMVKVTF